MNPIPGEEPIGERRNDTGTRDDRKEAHPVQTPNVEIVRLVHSPTLILIGLGITELTFERKDCRASD